MAHESQFQFFFAVAKCFPDEFSGRTLEIGSEDINGSLRRLFKSSEYVGVDLGLDQM